MSFVAQLSDLPLDSLLSTANNGSIEAARASLKRPKLSLADFAQLISPAADSLLETMGQRSHALTHRRFGKVIRLFAPLYLSNECVNNCKYCGFARENSISRVTLTIQEAQREAIALRQQGFRNLLLVASEHPKLVSINYLREVLHMLHPEWPSLSLEVGPVSTNDYRVLAQAGADGLVVFQETYNRTLYAAMHGSGPKRDFDWRLETPERAYAAGFRRLGLGPLFGLGDWRFEAIAAAAHVEYLFKHCWKAQITMSLPRLRPAAGRFAPQSMISDRELAKLVCALRLMFPDLGLVLSTREAARLRDGLIPLGITLISAGSHTDPGGYTGAGRERLHPNHQAPAEDLPCANGQAGGQFAIADERSPAEMALEIRRLGYEPVWKDWDAALTA